MFKRIVEIFFSYRFQFPLQHLSMPHFSLYFLISCCSIFNDHFCLLLLLSLLRRPDYYITSSRSCQALFQSFFKSFFHALKWTASLVYHIKQSLSTPFSYFFQLYHLYAHLFFIFWFKCANRTQNLYFKEFRKNYLFCRNYLL